MNVSFFARDEPEYCWDMLNENDYGGRERLLQHYIIHSLTSGIVSLSCYDVTGSGVPDMLVGREDGVVEVYSFDDSGEPRVQFTHVRKLKCSCVDGCYSIACLINHLKLDSS